MKKHQQIEVFCDFDGTVTAGDTVDLLLETLADEEWKAIEKRWVDGEIGSRECMALQVPLIRGGWPKMLEVLETVKVDKSFATFVHWCRMRSIPISIVSDGIDRVIKHLLDREGIKIDNIWANQLIETADGGLGLQFPKPRRVVCSSGLCKCQVLDKAGSAPLKVVIGDGRSDFCWSQNADLVFAKDKLLTHCQTNNISYLPYDNFVQIRVLLEELNVGVHQPVAAPAQGKMLFAQT